MTNKERLLIEIQGVIPTNLSNANITIEVSNFNSMCDIYLEEFNLPKDEEYDPQSNTNKKLIYQTAKQVLENVANNPQYMRDYKTEDITVTEFHKNLLSQIQYLNSKISTMLDDDFHTGNETSFIYLF